MKIRPFRCLATLIAMAVMPSPGQAASPWYGGVTAGWQRTDITVGHWNDGTVTSGSVEDAGLGYGAFVGYQAFPRLRFEAAWVDLGKTEFEGVAQPGPRGGRIWAPGRVTGKTRTWGLALSAAATQRLGSRGLVYAKGGIYAWDSQIWYDPTINDQVKINDDGISLTYGLGGEVRVYKDWHARVEWMRQEVTFGSTGGIPIDLASLSAVLRLR